MSGKSHDLISTSLYYVSKHATRERIKSQLNCHVTFRRQLHHSILSSPYYQLLTISIADEAEAELAEAKLATSLGSCLARVTNTTGSPLS